MKKRTHWDNANMKCLSTVDFILSSSFPFQAPSSVAGLGRTSYSFANINNPLDATNA